MLTLLLARGGMDVRGELLERMGRSEAGRRVLLVPEQYSHETERALCKGLGNRGARACEVLSFTRMSARVADVAGGGAAPTLDGAGRMLLLYRALRQVSDLLSSYRASSRRPAFLEGLLASIDECRSYGVTPSALTAAGDQLGGLSGDKLRDIGLIYDAYEGLTARLMADPRARLDKLARGLKDSRWAEGREVWIWGFTDFTPQQGAVLEQLLCQTDVTVALTCDPDDPSDIFEPARRSAAWLERLAKEAGVGAQREVLCRPLERHPSLIHLERSLFAVSAAPWAGECAVVRAALPTPRQEVEWAAAEMRRLAREEGYRWRDMALCARDFAPYEGLVDSVMARYGVPVFLSTVTDVLQKPVLALVTAALGAAGREYPQEEMLRYLKTGLTGLTEEEGDELENYVLTWDIRGGTWRRQRDWDMHPEGYGRSFSDEQRQKVAWLDGLRRRVMAPLERLRENRDRTGKGHALALYGFLEGIDLPRRLAERAAALEERGEAKLAAEYRQLWDILAGGLEQCALLLGDMELELEEFARLFSLALSQYTVGTIPVSLDRVSAGDAPRMAGKRVKVLFFLGADSTALPNCAPAPGLFSDRERERLADLDIQLAPRRGDKLQRELTIVYETCCLPGDRLYVSYAAADGAGGEQVASFLWKRLAQLFPEADGPELGGAEDSRLSAPGPATELAAEDARVAGALSALPGYGERVERICSAAHWRRGRLSPQAVRALYRGSVSMSATRLELYNSCRFAHFLKYDLKAKPRERAVFQATDYGTFVHGVLEGVLGRALREEGGLERLCADAGLRQLWAREEADRYEREALSGLEEESARFRHIFRRMKQAAAAVVDSVAEELAASDFIPTHLELGFGEGRELPPLELGGAVRLKLNGAVDRVDSWVSGGKRYVRVVDYKTGKKKFEFSDVADGRGLQMLLYLFALRREGRQVLGPEEVIPAGVLYIPARSPVVNGKRSMSDQEVERARREELRRCGLVLDDGAVLRAMEHGEDEDSRFLPTGGSGRSRGDWLVSGEELDALDGHITRTLERVAAGLAAGDIAAAPYWHDEKKNACRYCKYAAACHFEESCGDHVRLRRALSGAEFWQRLRGEEGEHGSGADR